MQKKWTLNLVTALLWALAAASAVFWGLRVTGASSLAPIAGPVPGAQAGSAATAQAGIARLLGAQPSEAPRPEAGAAERFTLAGVVADVAGKGVALISVDGKPAIPFAVGKQIAPGYVLKSVTRREAMLSTELQAPVRTTLSLPAQRNVVLASAPAPAAAAVAPAAVATPSAASIAVSPSVSAGPEQTPQAAPGAGSPTPQMAAPLRRGDQRGS